MQHSQDPPVRLFINALSLAPGGAFVVYDNYLLEFVRQRPSWEYTVLKHPDAEQSEAESHESVRILRGETYTRSLVRRLLWEHTKLPSLVENSNATAYFAPNGLCQSALRLPQFVLIQDPTPYVLARRHPRAWTRALLLRRRWRHALRHADCVGYTSAFMRSLVVGDAGRPETNQHLIAYNGISSETREAAQGDSLPFDDREPVILSVSAMNPHKNFETVIRAFAELRKDARFERYRLRIMGRRLPGSDYDAAISSEIERHGLAEVATLELDRPWNDIVDAYRTSRLFVLVSRCESFGIPVIEAMAHGLPVIAGDCCAVPEVVDDAGVLTGTDDTPRLTKEMTRLLSDTAMYESLQDQGKSRCQDFSWQKTVAEWIGVIESRVLRACN